MMKKLLILLTLLLSACQEQEPIIIGFSATLSGTNAAIGVQEMYGAELAVDTINESGGINGRQVVLAIRDDLNDPEVAVAIDNELNNLGAVAIIGHGFSNVAEATVNNANENNILLISPSIGTDALTGLKDNFIRLVPTASFEARSVTETIISEGHKNILLAYDKGNIALTDYHKQEFERVMTEQGLSPISYGYSSSEVEDYKEIISLIENNDIEALFIVGSSLDASNMIQLNKLEGIEIDVHLSAWASSGDIAQRISTGYEYVTLYNFFDPVQYDVFGSEINQEYRRRYGIDMTMVATYAYDAVMVLAEALASMDESTTELLLEEIQNKTYEGVQSPFSLNEYGDVEREIYQFIIRDGDLISKEG